MSGLLRRIKRSRTADAGETPAEGRAAAPDGAPTTAESSAVGATTAAEPADPGAARTVGPAAAGAARTADPAAAAPAIHADPDVPAGLDPAATAAPPLTGFRSRLRRRLRYLRRARELMLRDLGGLVYEVHRTAGGDVGAHAGVIGAKVERLTQLDGEARAIETALRAPRPDDVVFQPGVGGTCDFCGELYGSSARYCSNCGSPTGSAVRATPAPLALPLPARDVPAMPKPPAAGAPRAPASPAPAAAGGTAAGRVETGVAAGASTPAREGGKSGDAPATGERFTGGRPDAARETDDSATAAAPDRPSPAERIRADDQPATTGKPPTTDEPATTAESAPADDQPATTAKPPTTDEPATTAESAPADDQPATTEDAHSDRPASAEEPPAADGAGTPFSSQPNGRTDEHKPPRLSSGDPLATKESRP